MWEFCTTRASSEIECLATKSCSRGWRVPRLEGIGRLTRASRHWTRDVGVRFRRAISNVHARCSRRSTRTYDRTRKCVVFLCDRAVKGLGLFVLHVDPASDHGEPELIHEHGALRPCPGASKKAWRSLPWRDDVCHSLVPHLQTLGFP